ESLWRAGHHRSCCRLSLLLPYGRYQTMASNRQVWAKVDRIMPVCLALSATPGPYPAKKNPHSCPKSVVIRGGPRGGEGVGQRRAGIHLSRAVNNRLTMHQSSQQMADAVIPGLARRLVA